MQILIPFYSLYGHVYKMALAVAQGVQEVEKCEAVLRRIPETLSPELIVKMGAEQAQAEMAYISGMHRSRTGGSRWHYIRHPHQVWQYVRSNAAIPGCHRWPVGKARPG